MPRTVSIIMPVKHVDDSFLQSLRRIAVCSPRAHEVIIVLDGVPGQPVPGEAIENLQTVYLEKSTGPAAARNRGANLASGEILLFVDADVLLPPDIVARIDSAFDHSIHPVAVFGSYDVHPVARNAVSQYKNLFHYYTHQNAKTDAFTFWTGCGGILREHFIELGGFAEKYRYPSIEDIELGYRIKKAGYSIYLDKSIQVTHLKRWTLFSLIKTDFLHRALPWSLLIQQHGHMNNDMNIDWRNRMSVLFSGLVLICLFLSLFNGYFILAAVSAFCGLLFINRDLFLFFYRRNGLLFMVQTVFLQFLYYLIGGTAFLLIAVQHYLGKPSASSP